MRVFDGYNVEFVYIWQTCREKIQIQIDCQIEEMMHESKCCTLFNVMLLLHWCHQKVNWLSYIMSDHVLV